MNLIKERVFSQDVFNSEEKNQEFNSKIKEIQLKEKGVFYINHWPVSNDFSKEKLLKIVESLGEYLEQQEIPYMGISVEENEITKKPLLVVHMDRETRAIDFGNDFPTIFMNLDVLKIIFGKYKQYEYK